MGWNYQVVLVIFSEINLMISLCPSNKLKTGTPKWFQKHQPSSTHMELRQVSFLWETGKQHHPRVLWLKLHKIRRVLYGCLCVSVDLPQKSRKSTLNVCKHALFHADLQPRPLLHAYVFWDFEVTCVSYGNHSRATGPFSANPMQQSYTLEGEAKSDQLCVPTISRSDVHWPWGSSFLLFSSWLVPPIEFLNCMAFTVPNSPVY